MSQFLSSCCFLLRLKIWQEKIVSSVFVFCVRNVYQRANCGRFRRLISSIHLAHSKLGNRDNCVVRAAQVGTWWCHSSSLPEIEDWRYWMFSHWRVRFVIWTHWKVQHKLLTWLSTSKSMEEKSDHRTVPNQHTVICLIYKLPGQTAARRCEPPLHSDVEWYYRNKKQRNKEPLWKINTYLEWHGFYDLQRDYVFSLFFSLLLLLQAGHIKQPSK